jgi:hypothetical protein
MFKLRTNVMFDSETIYFGAWTYLCCVTESCGVPSYVWWEEYTPPSVWQGECKSQETARPFRQGKYLTDNLVHHDGLVHAKTPSPVQKTDAAVPR